MAGRHVEGTGVNCVDSERIRLDQLPASFVGKFEVAMGRVGDSNVIDHFSGLAQMSTI